MTGLRHSLPAGSQGEVLRSCLHWCPESRATARGICRMPWISGALPHGVGPGPALASLQGGSGPVAASQPEVAPPSLSSQFLRLSKCLKQQTTQSMTSCACSGNCGVAQHRHKKCTSNQLVVGTAFCLDCICKVPGCGRPSNKSHWCYRHKAVRDGLNAAGQLAASTAQFAPVLVPIDLLFFIDQFPTIQGNLAVCIVIAMVKEPTAIRAMLEFDGGRILKSPLTGSVLRDALVAAIHECRASSPGHCPAKSSQAPHRKELEQLNRQGVARFFGLASTATSLGVITKIDSNVDGNGDSDDAPTVLHLGLTGLAYRLSSNSAAVCKTFVRLLSTAYIKAPELTVGTSLEFVQELIRYSHDLRTLLNRIGNSVPIGTKSKTSGYVQDFIVRKLCIGWLAVRSVLACPGTASQLEEQWQWQGVPISVWRTLMADSHENVAGLPTEWSSEEASSFVCGRGDWPFLTSMFMCLWKEVSDSLSDESLDYFLKLPDSTVIAAIEAFQRTNGFAPHPYVLASSLCGGLHRRTT